MPELPDITIYLEALERRVLDKSLLQVRINSPFLLRTFEPPLSVTYRQLLCATRFVSAGLMFSQVETPFVSSSGTGFEKESRIHGPELM